MADFKFLEIIGFCMFLTISAASETEPAGINRESRQLISLIKSFLQSQSQPQAQQKIQVQHEQSHPPLQMPHNPYLYPQQQQQQQQQQYYDQIDQNIYNGQPQPQQQSSYYPQGSVVDQKIHSAVINPNYQYPMMNYPSQVHSSVPYYHDNMQQAAQELLQSDTSGSSSSSSATSSGGSNQLLALLTSALTGGGAAGASSSSSSLSSLLGGGGNGNAVNGILGAGGGGSVSKMNPILTKLGQGFGLEDSDLSKIANLISFGTFEGMIGKVNQFDKLQCIPRMICQTVAKRQEDRRLRDSTSTTTSTTTTTTTTTTTERSSKKSSSSKKKSRDESGRFIKIAGVDTALDQFVRFLDVMQLKDWSLYPYIKGMTEGHQVKRSSDCAERFHSCPFSEDQLVYYFNNYNGGFFQSFRSGREIQDAILGTTTTILSNSTLALRNL